jgi:FixJ family two-component response regulator
VPRDIIAIVDDDALVREGVQRLVASLDFRCALFSALDEFLAFTRLDEVGCIVSDVKLADADAGSLPHRLSVLGRRIPVVFMTADPDPSLRTRLLATGAISVLDKPFVPRVLTDLIATVLSRAPT